MSQFQFPSDDVAKKAKHYRINAEEYHKICGLLGHAPQGVEWALFSALWSEHCSYKSSKVHLRKFSYRNSKCLDSEGENAGVVDLGRGEKIAFKMESHNHPSFIEPYQGAATGVGGILRDIFTMGARPIALADYLCFGEPKADRMTTLVKGVVSGISGYGNCVGVPTVTGQTEFHSRYNKNILVNAMAVGLFRPGDPIALSKAKGPGNWVVYVGAKTGKDGVHGASMASESFDDKNEAKKPNVQIGDPFYEKLLIESCLEVMKQDLVVAMQDMGAAGLTSSSFEMASKGGVGMKLHLDQVPVRDATITPEEILLSESQERMLLVCEPALFEEIKKVFHRWDLDATKIGEITASKKMHLLWKGETLVEIDPDLLVENPPRYERPYNAWTDKNKKSEIAPAAVKNEKPLALLKKMLASVRFGTKDWIHGQYDQRVGLRTVRDSSQSTALLRLPDSGRGLAIAVGCRPAIMRMDARLGAYDSVFYPALQMASKGAEALAVTDCLNFGNPEKPEIMSEFVASVEAIAEAGQLLDAPVISGNVSFYNETLGQNITSTPATGLVGLRDDIENVPWDDFTAEDLVVARLACPLAESFHQTAEWLGAESAWRGDWDARKARDFTFYLRDFVRREKIVSSKLVGKGGRAVTLALMSKSGFGFCAEAPYTTKDVLAASTESLFAERFYEVILAFPAGTDVKAHKAAAEKAGFEFEAIGTTKKGRFALAGEETALTDLMTAWKDSWSKDLGTL